MEWDVKACKVILIPFEAVDNITYQPESYLNKLHESFRLVTNQTYVVLRLTKSSVKSSISQIYSRNLKPWITIKINDSSHTANKKIISIIIIIVYNEQNRAKALVALL